MTGFKIEYHNGEHETFKPWRGALPPRAWHKSDASSLSLNGDWRFDFSPVASVSEDFAEPLYSDTAWDSLSVPSSWAMHGDGKYSRPQYQNIRFPFPVDPPRIPDENPTGRYRVSFELPGNWPKNGKVSATGLVC